MSEEMSPNDQITTAHARLSADPSIKHDESWWSPPTQHSARVRYNKISLPSVDYVRRIKCTWCEGFVRPDTHEGHSEMVVHQINAHREQVYGDE